MINTSRKYVVVVSVLFVVIFMVGRAVVNETKCNVRRAIDDENVVSLERYYWLGGNIETGNAIFGDTPLCYSIKQEKPKSFLKLLELGASPNSLFRTGTATQLAAAEPDSWWLQTILEHGGDPNLFNNIGIRHARSTPIAYAAKFGTAANIELLLQKGVDINAISGDQFTPLMYAAESHKFENVYCLLKHGADYVTPHKPGMTFNMIMKSHKNDFMLPDEKTDKEWYDAVRDWLAERGYDPDKVAWEWRGE